MLWQLENLDPINERGNKIGVASGDSASAEFQAAFIEYLANEAVFTTIEVTFIASTSVDSEVVR